MWILVRCGPLIDLCRGPHVRHTGKIKAMKIYKVHGKHPDLRASHLTPAFLDDRIQSLYLLILLLNVSFHSATRTLRPTGRAAPTWRLYRGSTGFLSRIQKCWRSGNTFRRRPRTETIARLAKWVTVGSHVQAHPATELKATTKSILIHICIVWWLTHLLWGFGWSWVFSLVRVKDCGFYRCGETLN